MLYEFADMIKFLFVAFMVGMFSGGALAQIEKIDQFFFTYPDEKKKQKS